ncbi:MAG: alpha amylase C-terminal domain-containing protein, partial [Bacteroidaceae bacterium]|nr:alpha amylase C-terminal domain-containing protein [Bacteroidaceae bacterium]
PEVLHFLLSNCKYWLDEFKFDGFRFDGVSSMLFLDHAMGNVFGSYDNYFNGNQDGDAICYLTLANKLIHQVHPYAITIAEEVSGMPGVAAKIEDGGMGFDYRLAMGIPDFWIKMIKEVKDEEWKPGHILWVLTNHRAEEKTINYAESHDQALVGDKTIMFRLADADMYWHMSRLFDSSYMLDRAIALHKMIRLITLSSINGGYLNFMGNEFGHPEWIDFPREGNGWSYKYARRQWHLVDDTDLKYKYLGDWDKAIIKLVSSIHKFNQCPIEVLWDNSGDQVLAFRREELVFVFNFHPNKSFTDYGILAPAGKYTMVLSSDSNKFGGFGLVDENQEHFTMEDTNHTSAGKEWLKLYIPARSCMVLKLDR